MSSIPISITEPSKISISTSSTQSSAADGTAIANASGGTPNYSYLWTPGGQTSNVATALAPGTYCVKVTDANFCTATTCVDVTPSCNLTAPVPLSGPTGVCKKQSGIVYCVTPNPLATSYMWILPDGFTAVGTTNGSCITIKVTTKFKGGFICSKAITPCGTTTSACMNIILVNKKPNTPGIITGLATLCPNQIGNYSIVAIEGATNYMWNGENVTIISGQGTTTVVIKVNANFKDGKLKVRSENCKDHSGNRTIIITKSSNCRLSSNENIEPVVPTDALTSLVVYPNPTNGKAMISFFSNHTSSFSLKVFDIIGRVIFNENLPVSIGYNSKEINLEKVVKGIYMVSIQEGNLTKSIRLIVQ